MSSRSQPTDTAGDAARPASAERQLRERVKELTCLYGVARVLQRPERGLNALLEEIVGLLPPAWQFPEIAGARIVLGDACFSRGDRDCAIHIQSAPIRGQREKAGLVEVFYTQHRAEFDDAGAFLREEQDLIDNIAREIENFIERLSAQEQRKRLEEQLLHADRLATIGQLAAGVAHELSEPLAAILGFAQLLQKQRQPGDPLERDLGQIVSAALHGRDIIRKLMIFSRQAPSDRRRVDAVSVVREALELVRPRCGSGRVELVTQFDAEPLMLEVDPAQLRQVIVNLAVNAIQAMPEGGRLTVTAKGVAGGIELCVRDTGIGMSEAVRQRLFSPFFTTKDVGEGTGLGLSVVHGIVTAHGGRIAVESRPGEGSTFRVFLPSTSEAPRDVAGGEAGA